MKTTNATSKGRPSFNKHNRNQSQNRRPSRPSAGSTINPYLFVKKANPIEEVIYTPGRLFNAMPLDHQLKECLSKKGYTHPTEIQDKTLEAILAGNDLMGIAQTGTGKTGAFLIPIVNTLLGTRADFQVLIVVPTRELAVQVEQEFKSITKGLNLYSACFIGGTNVNKDLATLRRASHIVIGTPGRLNDLGQQRALNFTRFTTLVLDEFDRLLDMGFSRDIQRIVQSMRNRKQTILFSATEDKSQRALISQLLQNPAEVRVSDGQATADHIEQEIVRVQEGENKLSVLLTMIRNQSFQKVIVFADTKRGVSAVCKKLQQNGIKADQIHGNKSQNYR